MSGSRRGMAVLWLFLLLVFVFPFAGAYYLTFGFTMLLAFIVAQSWDWVHGEAGYVNLGHYIYFGIGAYGFAISVAGGAPIYLGFVVAILVTGVAGAVLSFPLYRLRGDYFAFATLALLPLAELLSSNLVSITAGVDGIPLAPEDAIIWGYDVKYYAYYVAFACCIAVFWISVAVTRSPMGYALKGIRNDEEAAEAAGIQIFPVKLKVMVMSSVAAALAGAAYAWSFRYINPGTVFGLDVALLPVAMALLGGSGLLWGPLIGVLLLSTAQQLLLINLTMLQFTIVGLAILLIGRYMPGGLLRSAAVRRIPGVGGLTREHRERVVVDVSGRAADGTLPLPRVTPDRNKNILSCRDLTMAFGGNVAVDNVTLDVNQGEIVGLVGPNGSGKTTLFNCISKVYEPISGDVLFDGASLLTLRRDTVSQMGLGRTYQIPRPFGDLAVQENIAMPLMFRADGAGTVAEAMGEAVEFAAFAGLEDRLATRADTLNLQQKKALEFARALACRPKLLLVDEVASGLTPAEVARFVAHIREVRDTYGITVIWVEHIFSALSQVVDRLVVMEQGSILADGPLAEVVKNEEVLRTYLGSSARGVA